MISEKTCNEGFTNNLRDVLHENKSKYSFPKFSCKLAFITFVFLRKQKQEINFKQIVGLEK